MNYQKEIKELINSFNNREISYEEGISRNSSLFTRKTAMVKLIKHAGFCPSAVLVHGRVPAPR